MAGLWNRKFDWENGEDRVCKECNAEYHTKKPILTCRVCSNKKMREYVKKNKPYERKEQYPFDNKGTESSNRFCSIRTAMNKVWKEYEKTGDRTPLTEHYNKQLKEIEENGIWEWIWDRRDTSVKKDSVAKSINIIRKDYPDTRGHYED